jgi:hypothetical protein
LRPILEKIIAKNRIQQAQAAIKNIANEMIEFVNIRLTAGHLAVY